MIRADSRTLRASAATMTAMLVFVAASPASAEPDDVDMRRKDAQALFEQGVKLARTGESEAALASFRTAYDRYPSFRVLYNIGQLCGRVGDSACAVRAYQQYLRDGGADVPAKRREAVAADVRSLSRTVGQLRLRSNVSGDEVKIDDVSVGRMPIAEPVAVNAGMHKVVLVHDASNVEQTVKVVSGETASVQLDVSEEAAPSAAGQPAGAAGEHASLPPRESGGRAFPVVPWVITGALAAATAVSGVLAAGAYGSYNDKRDAFPITRAELDDAQGSARDLFVLTSVLGATTVISAAVATYLTLSGGRPSGAPSGTRVGVAAGPGALSVVGVFQ